MSETTQTGSEQPQSCTCGTILVEGARFCHRCGRPTFEMPKMETPVVPPEPQAAAPRLRATFAATQLPVGFKNPIALRVAFLMSVGIMMAEMIPGINFLMPIWWLAAGWGAVTLYRRLTGSAINVSMGARLGSITGVLGFASTMVLVAVSLLFTGKQTMDELLKQNPQLSQVLNDRAQLALGVLVGIVLIFAMVVGICAAGGALGARFAGRNGSPAR